MSSLVWIIPVVLFVGFLFWNRPERMMSSLDLRPLLSNEGKQLQELLKDLAKRTRVPMPRVWLISEFSPNIVLLSRFRRPMEMILSDGLLRALNEEELRAILILALCQGNRKGRWWQTRMAAWIFPFSKRLQKFPIVSQILMVPAISSLFWLVTRPAQILKADQEAQTHIEGWKIAAALQKVSVLGRKITWKRWDLAIDSLYLVSPLLLEGGPFATLLPQPSIEDRRAHLLHSTACETSASLT
jgi:Zn-dependent protease with chaperone function